MSKHFVDSYQILKFILYSVLLSFIQPQGDFNLYFKLQHYLNWQMALFWVCELIPKDRQHNILHGQLIMQGGRLLKNVHNHSFLRHWLIILGNINVGVKTPNHAMGFGSHPGQLTKSKEGKWLSKGFPAKLSKARNIWKTIRRGIPPRMWCV